MRVVHERHDSVPTAGHTLLAPPLSAHALEAPVRAGTTARPQWHVTADAACCFGRRAGLAARWQAFVLAAVCVLRCVHSAHLESVSCLFAGHAVGITRRGDVVGGGHTLELE